MEHILNFTEILLNVPLDGRHLLLSVDLSLAEAFLLGTVTLRAVLTALIRIAIQRFPADFQGHLLLRQRDAGTAGDGVLIVRGKADGLAIL